MYFLSSWNSQFWSGKQRNVLQLRWMRRLPIFVPWGRKQMQLPKRSIAHFFLSNNGRWISEFEHSKSIFLAVTVTVVKHRPLHVRCRFKRVGNFYTRILEVTEFHIIVFGAFLKFPSKKVLRFMRQIFKTPRVVRLFCRVTPFCLSHPVLEMV